MTFLGCCRRLFYFLVSEYDPKDEGTSEFRIYSRMYSSFPPTNFVQTVLRPLNRVVPRLKRGKTFQKRERPAETGWLPTVRHSQRTDGLARRMFGRALI